MRSWPEGTVRGCASMGGASTRGRATGRGQTAVRVRADALQSCAARCSKRVRRSRPRGPRAAAARGGSGGRRRRRGRRGARRGRGRAGGRCGGGGRRLMASMVGAAAGSARPWPGGLDIHRSADSTGGRGRRVERRARCAPAAGAGGPASGAPLNARLATVAKPCSSLAQREQQVRDAVGGRQRRGPSTLHAPAVHAPAARAHEQRARLPHEPDAERAALEHEPGARVQLARLVADEVAEQPERGRSGPSPARGRRPDHVRAALGVELRDRPRVHEQDRPRPATDSGSSVSSSAATATNGTVCATRA